MGTTEYVQIKYLGWLPGYLKNLSYSLTPFFHTDLKGRLESIVSREEPETKGGLLDKMLSNKNKSLKATIKALSDEINLREKMNVHLFNNIDEDICRQHTYMGNLKTLSVQYAPELNREMNNTKMQIDGKVLELEEEKRKEYLECWRDLMFLKKYLFMALREYWDMSNRRGALGYDANKLAGNEIDE